MAALIDIKCPHMLRLTGQGRPVHTAWASPPSRTGILLILGDIISFFIRQRYQNIQYCFWRNVLPQHSSNIPRVPCLTPFYSPENEGTQSKPCQ